MVAPLILGIAATLKVNAVLMDGGGNVYEQMPIP